MKVTDNMVEILKSGGSIKFQNWIVTAAKPRLPKEAPGCGVMLFAISPVGDALELPIDPVICSRKSTQPLTCLSLLSGIESGSTLRTAVRVQGAIRSPGGNLDSCSCQPGKSLR